MEIFVFWQARLSSELRKLFNWVRYDFITEQFMVTVKRKVRQDLFSGQFALLEKACEKKLVKFVTHRNPQVKEKIL